MINRKGGNKSLITSLNLKIFQPPKISTHIKKFAPILISTISPENQSFCMEFPYDLRYKISLSLTTLSQTKRSIKGIIQIVHYTLMMKIVLSKFRPKRILRNKFKTNLWFPSKIRFTNFIRWFWHLCVLSVLWYIHTSLLSSMMLSITLIQTIKIMI
jgi:hypothetical protein